jgi:hypothetical protein
LWIVSLNFSLWDWTFPVAWSAVDSSYWEDRTDTDGWLSGRRR